MPGTTCPQHHRPCPSRSPSPRPPLLPLPPPPTAPNPEQVTLVECKRITHLLPGRLRRLRFCLLLLLAANVGRTCSTYHYYFKLCGCRIGPAECTLLCNGSPSLRMSGAPAAHKGTNTAVGLQNAHCNATAPPHCGCPGRLHTIDTWLETVGHRAMVCSATAEWSSYIPPLSASQMRLQPSNCAATL